MKVILFGASGHIGFPVAQALVRSGHVVVGVSRNESTTKKFRANEIIPLIGDIYSPDLWKEHLVDTDVVIDTASGDIHLNSKKLFQAVATTASAVRSTGMPKVAYIHTSGTWVHGDNRSVLRSDGSPLPNPSPIVAWRPLLEQEVITSSEVRGIVIRPSLVYGRGGGLTAFLFGQAESGQISWFGTPGGSYATVHGDDLAEAYLLATEKNHIISGLIIDVSNEHTESVDGILYAFAQLVGIPLEKVKYRPPANPIEAAMSETAKVRPSLARTLLGWAPRKASWTDGIATYYEAYKATRDA